MKLENQVAVVTGAARGIGLARCERIQARRRAIDVVLPANTSLSRAIKSGLQPVRSGTGPRRE